MPEELTNVTPQTGGEPGSSASGVTAGAATPTAQTGATESTKTEAQKTFSQADIDKIIKDRLAEEKKRAAKEAEQAKLQQQGEYQKLLEQLQADHEVLTADHSSLKERLDKILGNLTKTLEAERKTVPDYVLPLLDKLEPEEQFEYITANRAKWAKPLPPNVNATAQGGQRQRSEDERRELAAKYGVKPEFLP